MRTFLGLVLASACSAGFLAADVSAAQAHPHTYYGDSARQVARYLGCENLVGHGAGQFNHDSGVCYLRGRRVNVITFTGPRQQRRWNLTAAGTLGRYFYWGNGTGALVVAKNGNLRSARLGARLLPGVVRHGA